ncbi:MAG: RIP metalloprotease RseP [Deltaproteobacteria bacterium]|nr:MAG: RIP metalloprotease RseP [Deltaproteobacteria bacterium]
MTALFAASSGLWGGAQAGLAGIAMIGVLVVVHEFGHFVFAKLFGIGVPVFSIGMGPRVWGFHRNGTDYRVSAVPVGGYVQLSGADPFGDPDWEADLPDEENFMKKPIWQRLLVMLGGPLFNLVTPFVVFTAVLMLGEPHADTKIGEVYPGSIAAERGLHADDRVVAVDGVAVDTWADMRGVIEGKGPGNGVTLTVARSGAEVDVALPADELRWVDGEFDSLAMGVSHWRQSARIGVDQPSSPAGVAGLEVGDGIVAVDGASVRTYRELLAALDGSRHTLSVKRQVGDALTDLTLTVEASEWAPPEDDLWGNRWGLVPVEVFVWDFQDHPESGAAPARLQGMEKGDRLWSIDGKRVAAFHEIKDAVNATVPQSTDANTTPRALDVVVMRNGERIPMTFTPRMDRTQVPGGIAYRPFIGVRLLPDATLDGDTVPVFYGPFEAARRSVPQVGRAFKDSISGLTSLLTGEMRIREGLGGPVAIFSIAAQVAERGLHSYARLIGIFSISLGLINLLPIPVLDGGQILFYSLEGIRGRPLPLAVRERIQMAGVLFLVGLMLLVTVFDVNRVLFGGPT